MIPHNRPWITTEDRAAVDSSLLSGWVAEGPQVEGLEADFQEYLGGGFSCAVSSGTAALFMALRGLGVEKGIEVAVPTYACSALLNAVHMANGTPRVVDVSPNDFVLDASLLPLQAPNATVAVAVHTFGARAPVEAIQAQGLKVVEDCCQSLGGLFNNKPLGIDGEAAIFSFYATKLVTGGYGGLVWSRNRALLQDVCDYREFDCCQNYYPRFNFQLADPQAAMIRSQFERLDEIASRRHTTALRYKQVLPEGFSCQAGITDAGRMAYRFTVLAPEQEKRDALKEYLQREGVKAIVPVERYELLHCYLGMPSEDYPVAECLVDKSLSLPLYPALSEEEIVYICEVLRKFKA